VFPAQGTDFSPFAEEAFQGPFRYLFCCPFGAWAPADKPGRKMGRAEKNAAPASSFISQ
jgi:hypothetical protein